MNHTAHPAPAAIETVLESASAQLATVTDCPALEAQVLLGHALGKDRTHLIAWPERTLEGAQLSDFQALVRRRRGGEPLAYITGRREFWSLALEVSPHTLIPRPETELLVELALAHLPPGERRCVADVGTGSGAIALAIAAERPLVRVIATDIAADTLAVARRNAERLGLGNVEFRRGHWLAPLAGEDLDVLCCNPPYLRDDDPHLQAGDLPHEPRGALAAGPTGLEAIETIAGQGAAQLKPGARLVMEHGYDQAAAVARCLTNAGFDAVVTHRDLAGHERTTACKKGSGHG